MTTSNSFFQAFTLVETVTALFVSGIIFVGVFSIFAILEKNFEEELVRRELVAYCNYALDDMARSIRVADEIEILNGGYFDKITTKSKGETQDIYELSEDEGILKNITDTDGMFPIHEEMESNIAKHKIIYIPKYKNGFLKYKLDKLQIYALDDPPSDAILLDKIVNIYTTTKPLLKKSSFAIELHAALIMGRDEEDPANEGLDFKRIAFSAGTYLDPPAN